MANESNQTREAWSDAELRSCVFRYVQMLEWEANGSRYVKKQQYRELSEELGRTESSVEFRMQNISAILDAAGKNWVSGLPPAKNAGANVAAKIGAFLVEATTSTDISKSVFDSRVQNYIRNGDLKEKPVGNNTPSKSKTSVDQIVRDPAVKGWVLKNAAGKCESCTHDAPFKNNDGYPYLEVHHVKQLAYGGSDTIENAVALCPNCHRAFHFAQDRKERCESLYKSISRLKKE